MGAALHGRDQVDVAFGQQLTAFRQPQQRPVHRFGVTGEIADERRFRQGNQAVNRFHQVVGQAILVAPALLGVVHFVDEIDLDAGAQHRFGFQQVSQARYREARAVEELFVRPEVHAGAGIAFAAGAGHRQILHLVAVFEGDAVDVAVAAHVDFHPLRQGVDHRDPNAVQAAGELVVFIREFTAGVQPAQDQLNCRHALFRVDIHRHAAAVVDHFQRLIGVQNHVDTLGVTGQRFVDAVIDHLLAEVVWARRVGIHAGTTAHWF